MTYGFNAEDKTFTFRNGRTVKIRQVSYHLEEGMAERLKEEYPPPPPPVQSIVMADGVERQEENAADPEYQQEFAKWQRDHYMRLNERIYKLLLRRGVEMEIDRDAVKALRSEAEDLYLRLSDDDAHVYLFDICVGSPDEEIDLIKAIRGLSYPTEEKIAQAVSSFRRDVSR